MLKEAKVSLTYLLTVTEEDLNLGSDYTDKEFKNAVKKKHKFNSVHRKDYMKIIRFAKKKLK